MLRNLNLLILNVFMTLPALAVASAYQFNTQEFFNLQKEFLKKMEILQQEKEFQTFQNVALQRKNTVLEDSHFQNEDLQHKSACFSHPSCESQKMVPGKLKDQETPESEGILYLFVSFSLGEKALLNLAKEAKRYGATLVLRGFVEGSYTKTIRALQKIIQRTGEGFLIDPDLFTLFSIRVVPTFILTKPFQLHAKERTQTPLHDRLQGHVSLSYALETFTQKGDLKLEAQELLRKGQGK